MLTEFQERMRVVSYCPIRIFVASYQRRYWYPYILQHYGKAFPARRDECLEYILDSGISNEEITNEQVLDKAAEYDGTYVVPKDYLQDQEATTESVREFLDLYENHECRSQVLVPLQPPYRHHYERLSGYSHYVLGGIANARPEKQLDEIRGFRDVAGDDVYAHGLGLGASLTLVRALREEPQLLDALDFSTPEYAIKQGEVADATWQRQGFDFPKGEDSSTVRGYYSLAMAIQLNYMLGPYCDDEVLDERYEQSGISEWGDE